MSHLASHFFLGGFGLLTLTFSSWGEPISFGAMGCGPYYQSDLPAVRHYMQQENKEKTSEFLVHVGDLFNVKPRMPGDPAKVAAPNPPTPSPASKPENGATAQPATPKSPQELPASDPPSGEELYQLARDIFTRGNSIPLYVLPGDNEWNDTSRPSQAWQWWSQHLLKLDEQFKKDWPTQRPTERSENFAFFRKGVVFIGLNIVGGRIHDAEEWKARLTQNAQWVQHILAQPEAGTCRALVVLSQANPYMLSKTDPKDKYDPFLVPFRASAVAWQKPVLYLHADGHKWIDDHPWPEKNIRRLQLERWSPTFPTTQITVKDTGEGTNIFEFNRRLRVPEWKAPSPPLSKE